MPEAGPIEKHRLIGGIATVQLLGVSSNPRTVHFPPDNPGNFIVATQGKLQTGGTIIVSLILLEEVHALQAIRIRLMRISFFYSATLRGLLPAYV